MGFYEADQGHTRTRTARGVTRRFERGAEIGVNGEAKTMKAKEETNRAGGGDGKWKMGSKVGRAKEGWMTG